MTGSSPTTRVEDESVRRTFRDSASEYIEKRLCPIVSSLINDFIAIRLSREVFKILVGEMALTSAIDRRCYITPLGCEIKETSKGEFSLSAQM